MPIPFFKNLVSFPQSEMHQSGALGQLHNRRVAEITRQELAYERSNEQSDGKQEETHHYPKAQFPRLFLDGYYPEEDLIEKDTKTDHTERDQMK